MPKFINWLKRAKAAVLKGTSWVNKNIIQPSLPAAKTILNAVGYNALGNLLEKGSNTLQEVLEKEGYKSKDQIGKYVKYGSEYLMDTQRLPSEMSGRFSAVPSEKRQLKFQDSSHFMAGTAGSTPTQLKTGKFKKLF